MKLLALDGNSILNRAFYGIKLLTTKTGLYTNGVYGFMNILNKLLEDVSPDAVAVAFDLKGPTFRHRMYDAYKAGRKGMPEELAAQLPLLKELLCAFGYRILEQEGYEADDILGTLAKAARESGREDLCYIATGDRDSLQLVSEHCRVLLAATRLGRPEVTLYTPEKIREEYGVEPEALVDVKALMGDSSDNIPGVSGIGQKTALALISRFGSLDTLYEQLETADMRDTLRQKLADGRELAYLSRELGRIDTGVPISLDLADYRPAKRDDEALAVLLTRLEFFKLLEKLGLSPAAAPVPVKAADLEPEVPLTAVPVTDFDALAQELSAEGNVAFVCELPPLAPQESGVILLSGNPVRILEGEQILRFLDEIGPNPGIRKITHGSKALWAAMLRRGQIPEAVAFDTELAGYLLNPSASGYEIERLCAEYGVRRPEYDGFSVNANLIRDAAALPALYEHMQSVIRENGQEQLLYEIEIPLAGVLADMEYAGFSADRAGIAAFGLELDQRIKKLEAAIYSLVGYEFNLNSPKQLSQALFERLGLKAGKKTKSGYSTNVDELERLKHEHPAVALLLEYRQLSKLKSTYCDGLLKVIGADEKVHSSFIQTEARTGRISSVDPNMQNIPVRTELGSMFRKFFSAGAGNVLCDADYSQIELRVLADISGDPAMIDAFQKDLDIHSITASQAFHIPPGEVTPEIRTRAKAVNFGIVYGIGPFSLAEDIGVSYGEAKRYIEAYFSHYQGVKAYMNRAVASAKELGYSVTAFGRRRYLPELASSNANLRNFGERVAMNMPIQGTAADIIKIAMVRVWRRLREEKLSARLIMQVHDELIVEASEADAAAACRILQEEMQGAAALRVPLKADVSTGKTWYDAKA